MVKEGITRIHGLDQRLTLQPLVPVTCTKTMPDTCKWHDQNTRACAGCITNKRVSLACLLAPLGETLPSRGSSSPRLLCQRRTLAGGGRFRGFRLNPPFLHRANAEKGAKSENANSNVHAPGPCRQQPLPPMRQRCGTEPRAHAGEAGLASAGTNLRVGPALRHARSTRKTAAKPSTCPAVTTCGRHPRPLPPATKRRLSTQGTRRVRGPGNRSPPAIKHGGAQTESLPARGPPFPRGD